MISSIFPILCTLLLCTASVTSLEEDLMDTRTATSDIGWTTPQGSEWQEASTSHSDGNERRVLMVCRMRKAKQNNWVRSPYIPINGANRIYVEFEFTMRSCEDVPNVATCKETFNLYYYESDRDEATSTFPPWNEYSYSKVDTIAADKRFHRGTTETNIETRDIGPLKKNGIYLALQDTGACMALMHVRVYYKYCPQITMSLAQFPKTIAGPERTSLVVAEGSCVPHARKDTNDVATLHCNSDGVWAVPKGQCLCEPGFTSSQDRTSCKACGRGLYKPTNDNSPCLRCPAYSHSHHHGSTICDCMFGYFRSKSDPPASQCTRPPSEPMNLQAFSNETAVLLTWERPLNDGGRDDMYYRVECEECLEDFTSCSTCPLTLSYLPARTNLDVTKVKVRGLSSFTFYKFKVFAENGVSDIADENIVDGNHATVTVTTDQTKPPKVTGVFATNIDCNSLTIGWSSPTTSEDFLYEVVISDYSLSPTRRVNASMLTNVEINDLSPGTTYIIEVRASNKLGFGPFSDPLTTQTMKLDTTPSARKDAPDETLTIVVAVLVGAVCVIVAIVAILFWRRRSHRNHKQSELDPEKHPMFNTSSNLLLTSGYPVEKSYVDPLTYEDPQKAISDFAKEIEFTRVKIEAVIGGGEFGEVCRGRLQLPGNVKSRDVAIKTLKSGYSAKQKLDFLSEASIMGQFDHPNVIRLEGVVTRSRHLMIITEFMENGSLDAYLKKHDGGLSVVELCGMLSNIGSGMKYLADMGYIHRDLAARNILVDSKLVCKVSDFGMSRVLEVDDNATYTARGGKIPIRWTAPEAITFRKFTSASDVWSYGIVMWEVTSYGERPYWGMSNTDVMQAVGSGYRLPAPMDCPLVLHQLMLECWNQERSQRPTFGEIVTAIERMSRDPAQFKIVAGINYTNNGRLISTGDRITLQSKEIFSGKISCLRPNDHIVNCDVTAMTSWLEKIGLASYLDNFLQSGYYGIESICRLKPNDLCKLGMTDTNDQNILLDNVYCLKYNDYNKEIADNSFEGVAV